MVTLTVFQLACICGGCLGFWIIIGVFALDAWLRRELRKAHRFVFYGME